MVVRVGEFDAGRFKPMGVVLVNDNRLAAHGKNIN
jgi:hypothetical protein